MSITLRIILIISSILSLIFCYRRILQTKMKINESIGWIIGTILLIIMSIFSNVVEWISIKLGFLAPVNFVFFVFIIFLLIQIFNYKIKISELNEKVKNLDHYIALKENRDNKKTKRGE